MWAAPRQGRIVKRPQFIQIQPDEVERVGLSGAYLLALVRYATRLDNERDGRWRDEDGAIWWEASYDEFAAALGGLSKHSVGRTVRKLETARALLCRRPGAFAGDQAKVYRVPDSHTPLDQQCAESHGVDLQYADSQEARAKSQGPRADSHAPRCENAQSIPSLEELREEERPEGEERARVIAPAPAADLALAANSVTATPINAAAPKPFCDDHPHGEDPDCHKCWDRRKYVAWWEANTQEGIAHQHEVAVRRAAAWLNSKGEARDRHLIGGKTRLERVLGTLGNASPKPRPVASERVREITDAEEDELP